MSERLERTPLYEAHVALGGRMVGFAGWETPLQYVGILQEARAVRSHAGLFDVSHMGRLHLQGRRATRLLEWVVTNDVANLPVGRGRYTCLCNEQGGIIDDAIYYRFGEQEYLLVCNADNRRHVVGWLQRWSGEKYPAVSLEDRTQTTAMVAFQGPQAASLLGHLSEGAMAQLRRFNWTSGRLADIPVFAARTGYTGEDGFEFVVAREDALRLWRTLAETGAVPCGLGARDVLRLETSLVLHGNDIDTSTTPLEAGLARFVNLEKEFVGVQALRRQKQAGLQRRLVGLRLRDRRIARHGYAILAGGRPIGMVTSGTYSPTLNTSIALGYAALEFAYPGQVVSVQIRDEGVEAEVVSLPFYSRKGER